MDENKCKQLREQYVGNTMTQWNIFILMIIWMMRMRMRVYCVDLEDSQSIEHLDSLNKPGVIEIPIFVDETGNLHLFLETCSGTSPPCHVLYSFLQYYIYIYIYNVYKI